MKRGHFTLPGEAGYEALTLELAERWGADVIRDGEGTHLSDEILQAGYRIYSTVCPIREHNEWIRRNPSFRQQTFLCTPPCTAEGAALTISVMQGFFAAQFDVNDTPEALPYWQVYDRTTNQEVPCDQWAWSADSKTVQIQTIAWHQYTVSFLVWRIWEEISMYNHTTNHWTQEHLMQLNPYDPAAQAYLTDWFQDWCAQRPLTSVVRFTSLFYNFVWIWGADERNRNLFVDWASYDFTVCPAALDDFAHTYGYALCAEDFVNQGKYCATHRVPSQKKRDWMDFISAFVRRFSRELVNIAHAAGKEAYVFYDDSWVGMEPYNGFFEEFGFDGIIKCVFSGFEVRLCAGVPVKTHEIRFHPYLFPVGLCGAPTFSPGGQPGRDALQYWVRTRRALLRQSVERAGLGGYLHLAQEYPDFLAAMDRIVSEFQTIRELHEMGAPYSASPKVGILTAWGKLRTWTLSGHFHETDRHVLIHVLEGLSGLPVDVEFLSFDDIKRGIPEDIDVILSAGEAGSSWSGGELWQDAPIVEALTAWVHSGGVLLGIGAPGAVDGYATTLRMAHVLGVDLDRGERACHGRWTFTAEDAHALVPEGIDWCEHPEVILTDAETTVLAQKNAAPTVTLHPFGKGKGIYLAEFVHNELFTRLLQNLLLFAVSGSKDAEGLSENPYTECAVYPAAGKLAFINNTPEPQTTACTWQGRRYSASLAPYAMEVVGE